MQCLFTPHTNRVPKQRWNKFTKPCLTANKLNNKVFQHKSTSSWTICQYSETFILHLFKTFWIKSDDKLSWPIENNFQSGVANCFKTMNKIFTFCFISLISTTFALPRSSRSSAHFQPSSFFFFCQESMDCLPPCSSIAPYVDIYKPWLVDCNLGLCRCAPVLLPRWNWQTAKSNNKLSNYFIFMTILENALKLEWHAWNRLIELMKFSPVLKLELIVS